MIPQTRKTNLSKFSDYVTELAICMKAKLIYQALDLMNKPKWDVYRTVGGGALYGTIIFAAGYAVSSRFLGIENWNQEHLQTAKQVYEIASQSGWNTVKNISTAGFLGSGATIVFMAKFKDKYRTMSSTPEMRKRKEDVLEKEQLVKMKKELFLIENFIKGKDLPKSDIQSIKRNVL